LTLVTETTNLLIKQYWEKPKAKAEIEFRAQTWQTVSDFLAALDPAFDLDNAVGAQLDVLGRIVGISRNVPDVVPKVFFGFSINSTSAVFQISSISCELAGHSLTSFLCRLLIYS